MGLQHTSNFNFKTMRPECNATLKYTVGKKEVKTANGLTY